MTPAPRHLPTRAFGPVLSPGHATSLHERLVARDEQALTELIDLIAPWLLGIAQGVLQDADEAEEVVQESFATVWDKIGQVPADARGLLPWVLRVTRNRAIDRLRSRRRRLRKAARFAAHAIEAEPLAEPEEPNDARVPGWHVHVAIRAALEALPPEQRTAVWLAYFEGLTHSAIAERLGLPVGTVKTRLRLAFDKLRPVLAPMKDWIL